MKLKFPVMSVADSINSILCPLAAVLALFTTRIATAQTVAIVPQTLNYWAGVNTSNVLGVGSNSITMTGADGVATINFAVTGQPSGLTTLLSTNFCTNSTMLGLFLNVTNVTAGAYPLTVSGSGAASYSTNVNLFVVPQWSQTNVGSYGNWSDATKWSGGATPGSSDSVYFEPMTPVVFTNVVDSSRTIQSLVYIGDGDLSGASVCTTVITNGATLSVVGTNGVAFASKVSAGKRTGFYFFGGGALVVNNTNANFAVANGSASSSANGMFVNMTNLNNFSANVKRFGVGDGSLNVQGLVGGNIVNFFLAKTNTIKTQFADDYTALNFDCALQYQCNKNLSSGSGNPTFNLGLTNGIFADSLAVGRAQGSSGVSFSGGGSAFKFTPTLANSVSPTATAYFRGTNGGRMSLVAVGVDTGAAGTTSLANCKGSIDLRGGTVDMLVDQIWLGHNRTNAAAPNDAGAFLFDWGTVNANTIQVGYEQFTNNASVQGYLVVGTNGTLTVNNSIELGHTPSTVTGFEAFAGMTSGQIQINGGGTLRARQINVGTFSTNDLIIVSPGGSLLVSNTIAQPDKSLTLLSLDKAQLTFFVNAGTTNAYVTNLTTTVNASKINIASISGFASYPATNVLIAYKSPVGAGTHNISIGSEPAGFNNMQIVDDGINQTINRVISTNQPKNLVWRGFQNAQWDHASTNWIDLNLSAPTNVTKFTDGDSVKFDDAAGVPTSVSIAETVLPGQTGTGITVSNSVNSFVFNNAGVGAIGACALLKQGTANLEIDPTTAIVAQIDNGSITVGVSGTIANATVSSGKLLNNAGTVSGGVTCGGLLQNAGTISGALAIQSSGLVTNGILGSVNGALSVDAGGTLCNLGNFSSIGSSTILTNSTLVNAGTIYGTSLTINGSLVDTTAGSSGVSPGSINVGSLVINGTFKPGGDIIGTTKVTDYASDASTQLGNPNGRVQLNPGSTTIFQVNVANAQPYTKLLSQNQGFGPSQASKAINGCTLVITNVGATPFFAGQTFKLFGAYYTDGSIGNAGLNTTNSYPLIQPKTPGAGLLWDLSQLIPGGTIGVISSSSVQITLTNNVTIIGGSNIVSELSWPVDYVGSGWLQQQITTLTNGLGTNWSTVGGSTIVNDIFLTNTINANSAVFYRFVRP